MPSDSAPSTTPRPTSAPDVTLPLRFLLTGLVALTIALGFLVARPELLTAYHYHQHIVAVTHLVLLGFILSVIIGATYQLVPVVLETPLHSETLARWHYPIHVVSVAGMVVTFWTWNLKDVGHFGSGLALGIAFFLWNLGRTLFRVRGWTFVSFGIASSLAWLAAVVLAGLAVAAAKSTYELVGRTDLNPLLALALAGLKGTADLLSRFEPLALMHAHAHLGVLGAFLILLVSVAYKLVPMFVIGEVQHPRRAWASLVLLNAGMAAVLVAVLFQAWWKPAASLLVVSGLALYGAELVAIVRHRRRRVLDWGLRGFLAAQITLTPVAALGLFLSWPTLLLTEGVGRLENAYGFLALLGVLGFAILGMLQKILPFLVWFSAYSPHVGRARTPALHEMAFPRLPAAGVCLWLTGLIVTLAGIGLASNPVTRLGTAALALGLVAFGANTVLVLRHLLHPQLQPLTSPGTTPRRPETDPSNRTPHRQFNPIPTTAAVP